MLTVLHDAFAIAGYDMKSPQSALCCPQATYKAATMSIDTKAPSIINTDPKVLKSVLLLLKAFINLSHQECIYLIKNTVKTHSNNLKYYYNLK